MMLVLVSVLVRARALVLARLGVIRD